MKGAGMGATEIAIYGGGGFAREVAWLAESCSAEGNGHRVVAFVDDDEKRHGSVLNDVPVMGLIEAQHHFPDALMVGGVGSPATREALMTKAAEAGFAFASLIHDRCEHSSWIDIGPGAVICAGSILTTNITLGDHVQINLDCTIGHDVRIGDYVTLAPGVHISGRVELRHRVYVGTGAAIINGTEAEPIVIGEDAVVGAGAVVTKPVENGTTVVGVPAKPLGL
jgi:sugar O-acyltransferase (sialic acid O-acetyltransferase NeuD family)